jgi:uncharacterized protein (TIGR00255 family)
MTGFGDASTQVDGVLYTVELRTLNNRYLKTTIRLPDELLSLEPELEIALRKRVTRGSLTLIVNFRDTSAAAAYQVNSAALAKYLAALEPIEKQAMDRLGSGGAVTIDLAAMLNLPGVVQPPDSSNRLDIARKVIHELANKATDKMLAMRELEGRGLVDELTSHLRLIAKALDRVVERAPSVVEEYHTRLRTRITQLMARAELNVAEPDLIREVAIFADRCDVCEEAQRLRAHLEQFETLLNQATGDPVGRTLDFLSQELLREANTIGSKSNDALIARTVVEIKSAIDRVKEQVQNVE